MPDWTVLGAILNQYNYRVEYHYFSKIFLFSPNGQTERGLYWSIEKVKIVIGCEK